SVEGVVHLDGVEELGVALQPASRRKPLGIDSASPVAVVPSRASDVDRLGHPRSRYPARGGGAAPTPAPVWAGPCGERARGGPRWAWRSAPRSAAGCTAADTPSCWRPRSRCAPPADRGARRESARVLPAARLPRVAPRSESSSAAGSRRNRYGGP